MTAPRAAVHDAIMPPKKELEHDLAVPRMLFLMASIKARDC
jgi:hypothetical protein